MLFLSRAVPARRVAALLAALALCLTCSIALGEAPAEARAPLNVLLIGVDGYDASDAGRSDVMLLLRADPAGGEVRMVSFLRDLYVPISGHGKARLNAAYFYGGAALLKKTLSQCFGVTVDRTVTVNFALAAELIDQLGGVEVEVSPEELSPLNDVLAAYNLKIGLGATDGALRESGLHLLNGRQVLSYCRIRKLDSDFQRTDRQRRVLASAAAKLSDMSFFSLARLVAANLGKVQTDLSLGDVNALLPLLTAGKAPEMASAQVPFPGTCADQVIDGMQVLQPDLKRNARKLQRFLTGGAE